MSIIVKLNVEGRTVDANDLKYNELISLYSDFIKRNGRVPTYADCTSKNNLPQPKIVKSLLSNHNILYEDFISSFGKTSHIRSNANNYSSYIKNIGCLHLN